METITLAFSWMVFQTLGISGLLFIVWYFDNKRFQRDSKLREQEMAEENRLREKEMAERERAIMVILSQYKDDVAGVRLLYEKNVRLVEAYDSHGQRLEKLFIDVVGVVSLNSQTQAQLTESIKNNQFCPKVREAGPQR